MTDTVTGTRERILRAAAELLAEGGVTAFSTRAVSEAAGVGAPTLYHHFGDKRGLLDATASYGFERYLAVKRANGPSGDPVADLRRGWDDHIAFGLAYPAFYQLMYGGVRPGNPPAGAAEGHRMLIGMLTRIEAAGLLRLPVEEAAELVHSAGVGVVFTLINTPEAERDPRLSHRARDAVVAAVTSAAVPGADPAVELRARLRAGTPAGLTPVEAALMAEWLERMTAAGAKPVPAQA
ncbi:TetR/AcrR family transcriptional regulator [Phytomonospora endophytica]|uniref:AcrR family transcriptional regulator n=1 Tax=Phytomonospora endophytica TaxID=714109 RepID=A0A841FCI3_9ACTN|nr:TetR/AcrR family transcriptional regulator [Phytomonospora endophytica]MBB6035001.1 AcrR family transcriptional regulator [Phytomonospora endophytica]GIG71442.1 TetR family transcriptional regulator [Phytomonospora endophytica]